MVKDIFHGISPLVIIFCFLSKYFLLCRRAFTWRPFVFFFILSCFFINLFSLMPLETFVIFSPYFIYSYMSFY